LVIAGWSNSLAVSSDKASRIAADSLIKVPMPQVKRRLRLAAFQLQAGEV